MIYIIIESFVSFKKSFSHFLNNIIVTNILIDMSNKIFEIPKDNQTLKKDITNRKKEYMVHIYNSFKQISEDSIPAKINVFSFKNTNLEVIIKKESYEINLKNLLKYFSDEEEYEICTVISKKLKTVLKNNSNNIDL